MIGEDLLNKGDLYYQFVAQMKNQCPETDENSWLFDSKAKFAFDSGYKKGRVDNEDYMEWLIKKLNYEEAKRKKLVELLKGKGVLVDATGEDVRIIEYK